MTAIPLTAPSPPVHSLGLAALLRRLPTLMSRRGSEARAEETSETRERCRFVRDMLWDNPEAFRCEQDVQAMMHCFPERF